MELLEDVDTLTLQNDTNMLEEKNEMDDILSKDEKS